MCDNEIVGVIASHPVRVRGLKPSSRTTAARDIVVAPRAGAWVETLIVPSWSVAYRVAPRAGAWVETDL